MHKARHIVVTILHFNVSSVNKSLVIVASDEIIYLVERLDGQVSASVTKTLQLKPQSQMLYEYM